MGAEITSACLTMLHVTHAAMNTLCILLVSNPAEIVVAVDVSELALQLRGYIAYKHAS